MPEAREIDRLPPALLSACLLNLACWVDNPLFEGASAGSAGMSSSTSTSGEGSTGSTSPSSTTTTTTLGSESSSGGASTTGVDPICCDLNLDPGEECDDGNALSDDGCLSNCLIPRTCAEILEHANEAASGTYKIDPQGKGVPWPALCDMDLDGGGWTGFTVEDTCNGNLTGTLTPFNGMTGSNADVDEMCRPFAVNIDGGGFHYFFEIDFQPGFQAFFLRDYTIFTISQPELSFSPSTWETATDFPDGSFSLGDAYAAGPVATWAKDGGPLGELAADAEIAYPLLDAPFVLGQASDKLRLSWAEVTSDGYDDGLYPWWSGRIFVR